MVLKCSKKGGEEYMKDLEPGFPHQAALVSSGNEWEGGAKMARNSTRGNGLSNPQGERLVKSTPGK